MIHYKNSRTLFFCQGAKGSASLIAEGQLLAPYYYKGYAFGKNLLL